MTVLFATPAPPVSPSRMAAVSPALRYALILWVAIGVAASVRTLLLPDRHTVFPVFASAGTRWWQDQPLYANYKPVDYFRYPPLAALFFSPFSATGLRVGGVLWLWLGLGVYASGIWRFRREVLPSSWTPRREAAYLALATVGALAGLWNGQSNALITGLVLWGSAALASGREKSSAGWFAVAVSLKPTALPLVLLMCALWPRRLASRFVLALAALALVPFLTRPPATVLHHYADWIAQQRILANERWPGFRDAWTVWQLIEHSITGDDRWLDLTAPVDSIGYRALQVAAAGWCLAWCLAHRGAGAGRRQLVLGTLSMGSAWLMLFGPAVEYPAYVFLAPFLAVTTVDPDARTLSRVLATAASGLVLVFGWGAFSLRLIPAFPVVLAALPVGTALFATGLVISDRQRSRDLASHGREAAVAITPVTSAAA
jgi:hypothetical protein